MAEVSVAWLDMLCEHLERQNHIERVPFVRNVTQFDLAPVSLEMFGCYFWGRPAPNGPLRTTLSAPSSRWYASMYGRMY